MLRVILVLLLAGQLIGCAAVVVGGAVVTGMAVHDRRSVGTVIDDNVLELRVRDALFGQEAFDGRSRIKVSAFNGWVLLAGEVPTTEHVEQATSHAAEVEGVQRLFNELMAGERASFGQASNDRWIASRVKASFAGIRGLPDFDPTRAQVTVTRGVVYLQGLVSPAEADAVIEQARTVRGVERVVTMFDLDEEVAD
ncbi:MAG: BON domain-containing protein [Wenzhouxiangella sp.]